MMNTNPKKYPAPGEEPVIRYDEDLQHRKHRTLLKVFVVFAVLGLIVLAVLWAVRRSTKESYTVPTIEELNATSQPVTTSIQERGTALNKLSEQSRDVTESREDQESALSALHDAN